MNKKGALELSITAIVVMIIAITVLSLAIFFIKNMFGKSTELIGGELGQLSKDVVDRLKNSGELMVVKLSENEVTRGKPLSMIFGIRNTESAEWCYGIEVVCLNAYGAGLCTKGSPTDNNVVVGGGTNLATFAGENKYATGDESWFTEMPSKLMIKGSEAEALPVTMLVKSATPDTYRVQFAVYKSSETDGQCGAFETTPIATKTEYIRVK